MPALGKNESILNITSSDRIARLVESGYDFGGVVFIPAGKVSNWLGQELDREYLYNAINEVVTEYGLDSKRVHLMGVSLGAEVCMQLASQYPHTFASVTPIMGGGQAVQYINADAIENSGTLVRIFTNLESTYIYNKFFDGNLSNIVEYVSHIDDDSSAYNVFSDEFFRNIYDVRVDDNFRIKGDSVKKISVTELNDRSLLVEIESNGNLDAYTPHNETNSLIDRYPRMSNSATAELETEENSAPAKAKVDSRVNNILKNKSLTVEEKINAVVEITKDMNSLDARLNAKMLYKELSKNNPDKIGVATKIRKAYEKSLEERGYRVLDEIPIDFKGDKFVSIRIEVQNNLKINEKELIDLKSAIKQRLEELILVHPDITLNSIRLNDTFSPHDIEFAVKYEDINFVSSATVDYKDGVIDLWGDFLDTKDLSTINHEYGHLISQNISEKDLKFHDEWLDAILKDELFVTDYASTNVEEDIAESFDVFYRNRLEFATKFINRYQLFSEIIPDLKLSSNEILNVLKEYFENNGINFNEIIKEYFETGSIVGYDNITNILDTYYDLDEYLDSKFNIKNEILISNNIEPVVKDVSKLDTSTTGNIKAININKFNRYNEVVKRLISDSIYKNSFEIYSTIDTIDSYFYAMTEGTNIEPIYNLIFQKLQNIKREIGRANSKNIDSVMQKYIYGFDSNAIKSIEKHITSENYDFESAIKDCNSLNELLHAIHYSNSIENKKNKTSIFKSLFKNNIDNVNAKKANIEENPVLKIDNIEISISELENMFGLFKTSEILKNGNINGIPIEKIFREIKRLQNNGIEIKVDDVQQLIDEVSKIDSSKIILNLEESYFNKTSLIALDKSIIDKYGIDFIEDLIKDLNGHYPFDIFDLSGDETAYLDKRDLFLKEDVIKENYILDNRKFVRLVDNLPIEFNYVRTKNIIETIKQGHVTPYMIDGLVELVDYVVKNNIKLDLNETALNIIEKLKVKDNELIINALDVVNNNSKPIIISKYIELDGKKYETSKLIKILENKTEIYRTLSSESGSINKDNFNKLFKKLFETNKSLRTYYKDALTIIKEANNSYIYKVNYGEYLLLRKTFGNFKTEDLMQMIKYNGSGATRLLNMDYESRLKAIEKIKELEKYIKDNNLPIQININDSINRLSREDKRIKPIRSKLYDLFDNNSKNLGTFGTEQGKISKLIQDLGITQIFNSLINEGYISETYLKDIEKLDMSDSDFRKILEKYVNSSVYPTWFDREDSLNLLNNLIGQVKKIYKGMSDVEATRFLYLMETREAGGKGICNYASFANLILEKYIGKEEEFLKDFGYPMYIETKNGKVLNDAQLLTDMYAIINKDELVIERLDGSYLIKSDNKIYINLSASPSSLDKFFNEKGINLKVDNFVDVHSMYSSINKTIVVYDEIIENISEELQKGRNVMLSSSGFDIYTPNGNILRSNVGGHIMTIVGINEKGNIIVDSWGKKLEIDLRKELQRTGTKFNNDERYIQIRSFDLVDSSVTTKITSSNTTSNNQELDSGSNITIPKTIVVDNVRINTSTLIELLENPSKLLIKLNVDGELLINRFDALFKEIDISSKYIDSKKLIDIARESYVYQYNGEYIKFPKSFNEIPTNSIVNLLTSGNETGLSNILNSDLKVRKEVINAINEFMEYIKNNHNELSNNFSLSEKYSNLLNRNIKEKGYETKSKLMKSIEHTNGSFGVNQGVVNKLLNRLGVKSVIENIFNGKIQEKDFLETFEKLDVTGEEILNLLNKDDGKFKRLKNLFGNRIQKELDIKTFNSLIEQMKINYPGISTKDAIRFLYLLEGEGSNCGGICNYATVANMIFSKYLDNEVMFEKDFGYPMYIETKNGKVLNDARLLVDMFSILNRDLILDSNGNFKISNSSSEYLNLAEYWDKINGFLESKNVDFRFNKNNMLDTNENLIIYEDVLNLMKESFEKGNNVMISGVGFDLYGMDVDRNIDGHIMTVLGIDSNGNLIVDSWGNNYLIDLRKELERSGEVVNGQIRYINIDTYEVVDKNTKIKSEKGSYSPNSKFGNRLKSLFKTGDNNSTNTKASNVEEILDEDLLLGKRLLTKSDNPYKIAKHFNKNARLYDTYTQYANATKVERDEWKMSIGKVKYKDPITNQLFTLNDIVEGYTVEDITRSGSFLLLNKFNRCLSDSKEKTLEKLLKKNSDGSLYITDDNYYVIEINGSYDTTIRLLYDPITDKVLYHEGGVNTDGSVGTFDDLLIRFENETKALHKALSLSPLKEKLIVGRGISFEALQQYGISDKDTAEQVYEKFMRAGGIYEDKGFMSCTIGKYDKDYMSTGGVNLIITLKEECNVGNFASEWNAKTENEVLVDYGSRFTIDRVMKHEDGGMYIYLTQL